MTQQHADFLRKLRLLRLAIEGLDLASSLEEDDKLALIDGIDALEDDAEAMAQYEGGAE